MRHTLLDSFQARFARWSPVPIRLIVGYGFWAHGYAKLARGPDKFAAIPMAVVLLVAIVTVHLPNGFSSIKLQAFDAQGAHFGQPGYETDLLYLAGLVALTLTGAGPLSLDRLILRRHPA